MLRLRRNIKEVCEKHGWEYLGAVGIKYKVRYDGFVFYFDKSTFPPIRITPAKCEDKTKYAIKLMCEKHKSRYSYENFTYDNNSKKSKINCKIHGEFLMSYNIHMMGRGCPKCKGDATAIRNQNTVVSLNTWIDRFIVVHGDRYDYSKISKIRSNSEVPIVCELHGQFYQLPYVHERGSGCPVCNKCGTYSRTTYVQHCPEGSYLYVLKMRNNSEEFVKIGISKDKERRIKELNRSSGYNIDDSFSVFNTNAAFVYDNETHLHNFYYDSKYIPDIRFDGYTECFSVDFDECIKYTKSLMSLENNFE